MQIMWYFNENYHAISNSHPNAGFRCRWNRRICEIATRFVRGKVDQGGGGLISIYENFQIIWKLEHSRYIRKICEFKKILKQKKKIEPK